MRFAPLIVSVAVFALTACHETPPATLEGHAALPDGRHMLVQGTTSLPPQAQLLVTLQDAREHAVFAQGLPLVKDGRFQTLLTLPNRLPGGAYVVRLTFSPAAFDWSRGAVLKVVGRHGENLSGPWAKHDGDVTILQRELSVTIPQDRGEVR